MTLIVPASQLTAQVRDVGLFVPGSGFAMRKMGDFGHFVCGQCLAPALAGCGNFELFRLRGDWIDGAKLGQQRPLPPSSNGNGDVLQSARRDDLGYFV